MAKQVKYLDGQKLLPCVDEFERQFPGRLGAATERRVINSLICHVSDVTAEAKSRTFFG